MKASLQIGKIFGIPIKIHFTFLIILALFVWTFAFDNVTLFGFTIGYGLLPIDDISKIILGVVLAILFFTGVLLHELGHSYLTQKYGFKINGITMFIFGGISEAEEIPRDPKMELRIAAIGPVISVLSGFLFYFLFLFINFIGNTLYLQMISITLGTLAFYNIFLGLFNLIPAFPIDGGRVLRSVLAKRMDYIKATKTASNIGKGFAIAMAVFGIFYNIWFVLIAVFVYIGASSEEKTSEISMALDNVKVKDIMTTDIDAVSPELTMHQFSEHMQTHKHLGYPVMKDKHLLGLITINELHRVDRREQDVVMVKDIMHKDVLSISPDDDAYTAFRMMTRNKNERLIVKKDDDVLGIVSWSDILHAIRLKEV